ncbi:penicillin-binding protein 1C [Teretinema zuelzerae]|uniref:penicillin-binding protein 1C n=1 Tax=Teretinema zuelzerae TaxID=156 RepID=UPI001E28D528|nr:penicillin-binding protein 1C [Teretinema zuelzerae]
MRADSHSKGIRKRDPARRDPARRDPARRGFPFAPRRAARVAVFAAAFCALIATAFVARERISGDILKNTAFSRAYADRDGALLRVFPSADGQYRIRTRVADFPPAFVDAILLQEDRFFYAHPGVNPVSLVRAARETWLRKSRRMGASTITMQVVRLAYGIKTDTVSGKLRQIASALAMDLCYSKKSILEAYLNLAPVGGNIEGFQTGSWFYFGKPASALDLSELLILAVLPQDPVDRRPRSGFVPEETLAARNALFDSWIRDHPEDADSRFALDLPVRAVCAFPFSAPHFAERAYREQRSAEAGSFPGKRGAPSTSGLVRTTLDSGMQKTAERELERWIERNRAIGVSNGAVLVADRSSMEIRASAGSARWSDDAISGQVDGTLSKRSPGSTLKPFVYALALDRGLVHPATMLKDTPTGFNEYTPDNFRGDFAGPVSAQKALTDSRNIPAISLARDLLEGKGGPRDDDLYGLLERAGVSGLKGRDYYGLSLVLGSAELTMNELAGLYGALANGGRFRTPSIFPARSASDGQPLFTGEAAFITLRMLESNELPVASRSLTAADVPVAYKTGTSIGFKDAWSVAVAGPFVIAVWIGNFDGQGNSAFLGRSMAAPLLFNIADALLAALPPEERLFAEPYPENVSRVEVCPVSGALPGPDCPKTVSSWYIPGVSPIAACRIHRAINIDTRTGYRTDAGEGGPVVREVREFWPSDLLSLFAEAGLPRLSPPPYEPGSSGSDSRGAGFPPDIISPLANTAYVIRSGGESRRTLVLHAACDADSSELFWFADSVFVGRAEPGRKLFWLPAAGTHLVTAVDSNGRSSSVRITVSAGE